MASARASSLRAARHGAAAASWPALSQMAAHRGKPSIMGNTSIRMLTTAREKVKVLLVLYDGGSHANDVSCLPKQIH